MGSAALKKRILDYCAAHGVEVPVGFHRNPPSRYAIIDLSGAAPKLIARTWFATEDVVHYLEQYEAGRTYRIVDFENRQALRLDAGKLESAGELPS
ncbi:MAG: hypothetical protein JNM79_24315 [Burkholderiales bacterium]|nr:hypothetical protein [Burkholderiales bacterium]